jgi:hypothetical protein
MDALLAFGGPSLCPKCSTPGASAKFCEQDCSRGANEKGGQYASSPPALGNEQPPQHLHRVCRICSYEWLESCADAQSPGLSPSCNFCKRTAKEISPNGTAPFIESPAANLCGDCIDRIGEAMKHMREQIAAQGGMPQPPAGARPN